MADAPADPRLAPAGTARVIDAPLDLAFPRTGPGSDEPARDRPRNMLWAAVHADPPPSTGIALTLLLAFAVLRAKGYALRTDIAQAMALDSVMILRQRRAPLNACARAAELGIRKDRYLALRRHLLRVLTRVIETGSVGRREPETPANRQDGSNT